MPLNSHRDIFGPPPLGEIVFETPCISENLERRQKGERFRILDSAFLPRKPYKPIVWKVVLLGTFGGIGVGIGLVFLVEFLNPCFRRPEDLVGVIQAPLILTISDFSLSERREKYFPNLRIIDGKKGKHQHKQENLSWDL